jgi:PAS domain-containing protein
LFLLQKNYGKIALTGKPVRFVQEAKQLTNGWYEVYAFRLGGPEIRKVAIFYNDIIEQKKTEEAVYESEERLPRMIEIETVGVIFFKPNGQIQSLRATLGIALHSAFPMFLFWGNDLTSFYNDAFRLSLETMGNILLLENVAKKCGRTWEYIGPLIEQVMTSGQPAWFEDQLIPSYRNGRMDDRYWTFSYSPAYGDEGKINGVIVTYTETTGKVINLKQLKESKDQLEFAIEATQLGTWDLNPTTNKFTANRRLKRVVRPAT